MLEKICILEALGEFLWKRQSVQVCARRKGATHFKGELQIYSHFWEL